MAFYKVVCTLNRTTGITADAVQNAFYFYGGIGAESEWASVATLAENFYNSTGGGGAPESVRYYISPEVDRTSGAMLTQVYSLTQGVLLTGPPVLERTWTLGTSISSSGSMPGEVCTVLTLQADYGLVGEHGGGGTRPRQRRRGRLYIGPLVQNVSTIDGNNRGIPSVNWRQQLAAAGGRLLTAANSASMTWSVFSRTDWVFRPVVGGWVDDAWDIQRRRGQEAQNRTTFGVVG